MPPSSGATAQEEAVTYVEAVRHTLRQALAEDERVVLIGQDVGVGGGAFRATAGLVGEFGPERVRDAPISEGAFTGVAVGLALEGYRPVVEYQFADFVSSGFTQIVNVAAKMHFRAGRPVPLVIRAPSGGGFSGGPFHSQNPEAWFLHTPGLKVCAPSTVEDVGLLLGAAIRDPNPVLVFEQKNLYTRKKGQLVHDPRARLEGATVRRPGEDVTIVSYGAAVEAVLEAASTLAADSVDAEVVDLRVLAPLDWETVAASIRKTSRALIVHEAYAEFGVAAELGARIADELFEHLDAPVRRIGSAFHPVPFSPPLEAATLPNAEQIVTAVQELGEY